MMNTSPFANFGNRLFDWSPTILSQSLFSIKLIYLTIFPVASKVCTRVIVCSQNNGSERSKS